MNRVLVTGGAGTIGAAVVRRLLRDPDFEVRVSDQREAPTWMREGCEVHTGDLRLLDEARRATQGCTHVIHLAAIVGGIANFHKLPHTLTEVNNALYNAVFRAALDEDVERFAYVSSSMVFERAEQFPTREDYLPDCPIPRSAYGFSKLTGEVYCRAAHDEHGLPYTICRPFNAYGPGEMPDAEPGIAHVVPDLLRKALNQLRPFPIFGSGEQTRTLTHVDDIADGIVTAMSNPAGLCEDFNISASRELTVADITGITGQDGSYLAELLLEKGYEVHGIVRRASTEKFERIEHLRDKVTLHQGDLLDQRSLVDALRAARPDEIYNLAAMSFVAVSWIQPTLTAEFTGVGVTRILEAMREVCPQARFYQASSSEMFGKVRETPQNESTPFYPHSPYGVAKAYGHFITVNYRESYDLFACSGVLFNHESVLGNSALVLRVDGEVAVRTPRDLLPL